MKLLRKMLVVGLALAAPACVLAPRAPQTVVVIVVDTLRADHLGAYGYGRPTSPNIDAFAAEAAIFDIAYSTSTWTLPAFGSIFTGELPSRHGAGMVIRNESLRAADVDLVEHAEQQFSRLDQTLATLAETLALNGYATIAVVNNAFLHPEFGLSRGFEVYDYDPVRPERNAERVVEITFARIDETEERPLFLFVHFMDVHMPYTPHGSVGGRFASGYPEVLGVDLNRVRAVRNRIARGDAGALGFYTAAYDEEIAYVDEQVGLLFAGLRERGLWETALVVLTSDHGEAFFEHGRWEHGSSMFDEVGRIPLLIRGPGVRPGRTSTPTSLTDLMPTVLEALRIEPEADSHGVSLWPTLTRGTPLPDRNLIIEGTLYGPEQKAIVRWPYKAIYQTAGRAKLLFDLESDPNEVVDLSTLYPERLEEMMENLSDALFSAVRERSQVAGAELDPTLMQSLRALGYIR